MWINKMVRIICVLILSAQWGNLCASETQNLTKNPESSYSVQPGDVLDIMVWKEEQLQMDVLVRPDGYLSFPLAGEIYVQGKSFTEIQKMLTVKLKEFIPDVLLSVSAKNLMSNKIFIMGKVNKPGEYPFNRSIDVVQALAIAGGVTSFADVNAVKILRRDSAGNVRAIPFRYGDIEDGTGLKQNILLQSGDSVIVP